MVAAISQLTLRKLHDRMGDAMKDFALTTLVISLGISLITNYYQYKIIEAIREKWRNALRQRDAAKLEMERIAWRKR